MIRTQSAPAETRPNLTPGFDRIARRIGTKLREIYGSPEAEPLPVEHVELLLRLRHRERDLAPRQSPVSAA